MPTKKPVEFYCQQDGVYVQCVKDKRSGLWKASFKDSAITIYSNPNRKTVLEWIADNFAEKE